MEVGLRTNNANVAWELSFLCVRGKPRWTCSPVATNEIKAFIWFMCGQICGLGGYLCPGKKFFSDIVQVTQSAHLVKCGCMKTG